MAEMTLQQLLEFTEEDLSLNREGKLSEMQDYRLRVRRMWTGFVGAGIIFALVIVATLFIFFGRQNDSSILFIIGVGVTLCSAAIMGIITRYYLRLNADINNGNTLELAGKLERVLKPLNRRTMTYILRIGGADVVVSRDTFKHFEHNASYRLYRTPYTGILLSAEKTGEAST